MTIIHRLHSLRALLITLCLGICFSTAIAWGDEIDSSDSVDLINAWQETPVSTSRAPRPASRIAENVTVITAADIERLNAHTLADVLQTMPGIQLDYLRTPTTFSFFNLQGALNTTVLVLVDGVRQNDYLQGLAPPGLIPVQQIERIEIVKGAASTAWGSALGGVINIVTKSPDPERTAGGMVSGSIGSRFTADSRAELSGTLNRFGYYLSAGNLRSDGLNPGTDTNANNVLGKFIYTLPGNGTFTAGVTHFNAHPGMDEGNLGRYGGLFGDYQKIRRTNSYLKFSQPLAHELRLDLDGYVSNLKDHTISWYASNPDQQMWDVANRENTRGIATRLTWGDSQRNLVAGAEYGHVGAHLDWSGFSENAGSMGDLIYDRKFDQWAAYANGAYTIGNLTILPGFRHDLTGQAGDNTSYSLGLTYQLLTDFTLRTYAASGFANPNLNWGSSDAQKVKTFQAGFETTRIPYLWLKGTYFSNVIRHGEPSGTTPSVVDQKRQGFEVELRTTPLFGFSLTSGYTYLNAWDSETGLRLHSDSSQSVPPHTVKLALKYDNAPLGLRGTLTGNYVWWNRDPAYWAPMSDQGMLWDLHLNWKLYPDKELLLSPELFFSGHNLFNGSQTTNKAIYDSAPRWFEGGVRVNF